MDQDERNTIVENVELYLLPIDLKWQSVKTLWERCKAEGASLDDWSSWFKDFEDIIIALDSLGLSMSELMGDSQ